MEKRRLAIGELLLATGDIDIRRTNGFGDTVLTYANHHVYLLTTSRSSLLTRRLPFLSLPVHRFPANACWTLANREESCKRQSRTSKCQWTPDRKRS